MKGVIYFTVITFILSIIIVILNNVINKTLKEKNKIIKLLPGINCGACGFGSCNGMADELLQNESAILKCRICKNKDEILEMLKK